MKDVLTYMNIKYTNKDVIEVGKEKVKFKNVEGEQLKWII